MIGSTLTAKLSKGFASGYDFDLSISLLLTGPGKPSIEWNLLKREIFPKGKEIVYSVQKQKEASSHILVGLHVYTALFGCLLCQ
jgi:hypothetical protein